VKLLLDEHFSPEIARSLRDDHERDVLAVAGSPELAGMDDAALLQAARQMDRVLVTEDVGDFLTLARHAAAAGRAHSGLILTSSRSSPRSTAAIGRLVLALDALLSAHPGDDSLGGEIVWLAQDG
jgi:predicted nuclease of predicted toxin-antitoxin system